MSDTPERNELATGKHVSAQMHRRRKLRQKIWTKLHEPTTSSSGSDAPQSIISFHGVGSVCAGNQYGTDSGESSSSSDTPIRTPWASLRPHTPHPEAHSPNNALLQSPHSSLESSTFKILLYSTAHFCFAFALLVSLPHVTPTRSLYGPIRWGVAELDSLIEISSVWLLHFGIVIGFLIMIVINTITILFSPSLSKRAACRLLVAVSALGCVTYGVQLCDLVPFFTLAGQEENGAVSLLRCVQWVTSSPILVLVNFVISDKGFTREAGQYMLLQWTCIASGLAATLAFRAHSPFPMGWFALAVSLTCFVLVIHRNSQLLLAPTLARHGFLEILLWRLLWWSSVGVWSLFPVVWVLHMFGFVPPLVAELCMSILDFGCKMVYSVVLASNEFMSINIQGVFLALSDGDLDDHSKSIDSLKIAQQTILDATSHMSSEQLTRFLRLMTHELKIPLNLLVDHNKALLQKERTGTMSMPLAHEAIAVGESLLCQIDHAIEFCREDMVGVRVRRERVHLVDVIDHTVESMFHRALVSWLDVRVEYPSGDSVVMTDPHHLGMILTVLMDNAIKHGHPGSHVVLSVALEMGKGDVRSDCPQLGADRFVVIRVRNSLAERVELSKVHTMFEPHVVGHKHSSRGGLGIGLALVESKVRALGGVLEVFLGNAEEEADLSVEENLEGVGGSSTRPHDTTRMEVMDSGQPIEFTARLPLTRQERNIAAKDITRPILLPKYGRALVVVSPNIREDYGHSLLPIAISRVGMRLTTDENDVLTMKEDVAIFIECDHHAAITRARAIEADTSSTLAGDVILLLPSSPGNSHLLLPSPESTPLPSHLRDIIQGPVSVNTLVSTLERVVQEMEAGLRQLRFQREQMIYHQRQELLARAQPSRSPGLGFQPLAWGAGPMPGFSSGESGANGSTDEDLAPFRLGAHSLVELGSGAIRSPSVVPHPHNRGRVTIAPLPSPHSFQGHVVAHFPPTVAAGSTVSNLPQHPGQDSASAPSDPPTRSAERSQAQMLRRRLMQTKAGSIAEQPP